jgi:cardiolipin synthase
MPLVAPRLNFVNHRKIIVVDEHVALVGGMNIGDEYAHAWRDVMLRIEGPAVHALDHVFLDDWFFATDEEVEHIERDADLAPGDASCAIIASGPDREPFIHDAYFTLFTQTTERIWIVTPYFIPTDALSVALRTAAGRGVDVRIVLPSRSDNIVTKYAARSYYPELLAAGIRIYEYDGPMLHAKALVLDRDRSVVGSANVDTRSFRLSFEISCVVSHLDTTTRIAAWFGEVFASSHRVTAEECRNRSYPQVLLQSLAHLFSPML